MSVDTSSAAEAGVTAGREGAAPGLEPSSIADGQDHELDPRVVPLERTIGWIVTGVVTVGSLVVLPLVWMGNDLPWLALPPLWVLGNGALAWHLQRWPAIDYRHSRYRVDEGGIEIRRGVFWREIVNVPRARVQHTDVSQGPLERRYGLGTLVVHTAGTQHARVSQSGLDHAVALRIREHLLPREETDAV